MALYARSTRLESDFRFGLRLIRILMAVHPPFLDFALRLSNARKEQRALLEFAKIGSSIC
jgi:hypothetical protein